MLTRDPFHGRHAKPRRTGRRVLMVAGAAVAMAGAVTMAATHAHAATRTALGATVTRAAETAVARFTPSPAPLIPAHGSRAADRRFRAALGAFDSAGIPTRAELRKLAVTGLRADRVFSAAAGQLVMAVEARGASLWQDTQAQRLCGTD